MLLILVTPLLGSLKNYVKYKRFNILILLRTPLLYFLLQLILQTNNIWKILLIERWILFLFKIIRSLYRNDYLVKKEKYKIKYNINYD